MVPKHITICLKGIQNFLRPDRITLAYVLIGLGTVFLLSAAAHSRDALNAYGCLSGFISFICLMAAFAVAVQGLEDIVE